ncbi:FUSC family protein [Phyllobacterium pellucidum]|uniref:FUSC family protein n=1 Tax=Phyllobacterium pellucidum TaxID=2740464 RepID=UPI001D14D357|nr:FUSC family protein [Phyllobacterium sp. T1018]UGY10586.1 FUSC family protein [Phyllobacterium sp. T1018]
MNFIRHLFGVSRSLWKAITDELRSVGRPGPRLVDELECVLSVLLAIVFAHALGAQYVGWAAFSGYAVMRSRLSESVMRGTLRITGTIAGAIVALIFVPLIADKPLPLAMALALIGATTLYFALVSRRSYAWLFTGLTFCMILIEGMMQPASSVFPFARSRIVEILAGTFACIIVSALSNWTIRRALRRDDPKTATPLATPAATLWHKGAALHALQAGIALAFIPFIWRWTGFASLSQSSVTIMAVMLLPVATLESSVLNPVTSKIAMRFVGCAAGGVLAIAVLLSSHHSPLLMTLALCVAVIIGRHVENGNPATSYIGIQFALAFLVVLVPDNYMNAAPEPGLNRLAGILLGIVILEPVLLAWHLLFADKSPPKVGMATEPDNMPRE